MQHILMHGTPNHATHFAIMGHLIMRETPFHGWNTCMHEALSHSCMGELLVQESLCHAWNTRSCMKRICMHENRRPRASSSRTDVVARLAR
jgi:hypothetical protein